MNLPDFLRSSDGPPIVPTRGWSIWITIATAAAMGFLAVLSLAAGLAAGRLAETWQSDLAGTATVAIITEADQVDTRTNQALSILDTTPGITDSRVLSEAEHAALLEPWLGENAQIEGLPAPRLVEVKITEAGPDIPQLQARLDQAAPGARYDDHQAWRDPLVKAAHALELLAWIASILVILTASGMISLAAQVSLAGNAEVVKVVRLIGAADSFIARAFVSRIALRGLAGGSAGAAIAILALAAMPDFGEAAAFGITLTPGPLLSVVLLIGVPVGTCLVSLLTSWVAVRMALRRMA
ncbi:cell division protein FtsX [Rhodobacteraceae bacterium NNCM2]|nr:cell division protein FtsX [Coraliihabitans acroporae]